MIVIVYFSYVIIVITIVFHAMSRLSVAVILTQFKHFSFSNQNNWYIWRRQVMHFVYLDAYTHGSFLLALILYGIFLLKNWWHIFWTESITNFFCNDFPVMERCGLNIQCGLDRQFSLNDNRSVCNKKVLLHMPHKEQNKLSWRLTQIFLDLNEIIPTQFKIIFNQNQF